MHQIDAGSTRAPCCVGDRVVNSKYILSPIRRGTLSDGGTDLNTRPVLVLDPGINSNPHLSRHGADSQAAADCRVFLYVSMNTSETVNAHHWFCCSTAHGH